MTNIIKHRSPHSGRLERWFGADRIEKLSGHMRYGGGPSTPWYGPPINIADCPGSVWLTGDGDFIGDFDRGFFHSAADSLAEHLRRLWKASGKPIYIQHQESPSFGTGFASISDALLRASSGYSQLLNGGQIAKSGPTGVLASANSLWRVGVQPPAGAAGSAPAGGRIPTSATTGAMVYNNPAAGTLHLTGADFSASVINNTIMVYDRLFDVAKTINSTGTESVTGVPTRYTSQTSTAMDYIGGNFLFMEVGATAYANTAHNWTVCTYTDQAGASSTLPSLAGNPGGVATIADRFDMPINTWFAPLETGDVGVKALTQMQCSALVATGTLNFVIGHPIGVLAFPIINTLLPFDWLTNRTQAPRIFDNAALAMFEFSKPTTTATNYAGMIYATGAA